MSLKLAVVTETFPPEINGVAMTIGRLVGGLRDTGHQVTIIRPRQAGDADAGHDVLVRGLPIPGYAGLKMGWFSHRTLRQYWQRVRPDVVHVVTEGPLGWSAVNVARRLKIPVTSGYHTNFDRYSEHYRLGLLRPLVSAYLRGFHRKTQATMVPTHALAAELAGQGVAGVRVVGRGVDLACFSPVRRDERMRANWLADPEAPVCLYVGRLAAEKNLSLVLDAFAAIRQRQPKARMVWVGSGPAEAALRQHHSDHVFCGVQTGEALASHYASADIFLFASLTETYGNVVGEAMACGVPVVAYRSAAAAELIQDGIHGRVVLPGDATAFKKAACELAADRNQRFCMASAAHLKMRDRSWSTVVSEFAGVLREVAHQAAMTRI